MTTIKELRDAANGAADSITKMIYAIAKAIQEKRTTPQEAPEVRAAIQEVLRTVGELPMPAPEGVEFNMRVFIRCDTADISHVLNFPGNHMLPPRSQDQIFVGELIDQLPPEEGRRLNAMGLWRVMTRPEIARYKNRMARAVEAQQSAHFGGATFERH